MKMKKYNAPSIAEAMKLIRADLGEDAVILNSKVVVTKKFLGLVKHKSFEVVAGVDQIEKRPTLPSLQNIQSLSNSYKQEQEIIPSTPILPNVESTKAPQEGNSTLPEELKKEIADLKLIMQSMQRMSAKSQYPDELLPFVDFLKEQELGEELITAISDELFVHFKNSDSKLQNSEMQMLTQQFLKKQMEDLPIDGLSYEKKYINVLGPTGVGKTTTIAKMAARAVLEKKKKIGFITTDTYRIAAIEQLKT
ncbi:MAG: flagellar biosynthesis protein FlhF, partial [Solibacillus sp.]